MVCLTRVKWTKPWCSYGYVIDGHFLSTFPCFVRCKVIDRSNSVTIAKPTWESERQECNCTEIVLNRHYFQNERLLFEGALLQEQKNLIPRFS